MRSRGKSLFAGGSIADSECEACVARHRVPDAWGTREDCTRQVDHARKRLIIDLDQFGGVAGLSRRFRNAKRYSVADMPNLALSKERPNRSVSFRTSGVFRHKERRQTTETALSDITARENT